MRISDIGASCAAFSHKGHEGNTKAQKWKAGREARFALRLVVSSGGGFPGADLVGGGVLDRVGADGGFGGSEWS
jgi:hypothetical protein